MSSMYDRADEKTGETPEIVQWVATMFTSDQEESDKLQWPVSGASENLSVNCLEADMNQDIVSSFVPAEYHKGILELEWLPKHAHLGMTDSSSARPPLQPSNSQSSLIAAVVHKKGGGRKWSGTVRARSHVRCQHLVAAERHRQPISRPRSSTKKGSLQPGSLNSVGGGLKGINRAFDVVHEVKHLVTREKRPRSPTWSAKEKQAYLVLKVEASRMVKGKHWGFISQSLQERWGMVRSSKCYEDFWYTIRKSYRAIQGHELLENDPPSGEWISYWYMDEEERSKKKLPKSFSLDWCDMIQKILTAQKKRLGQKGRGVIEAQELFEDEDDDEYSHQQLRLGEQPHMAEQAEMPDLDHVGSERFSAILEESLVQQQVEDIVDSALQRLGCRMRLDGKAEEDDLITMLFTVVKQKVLDAINEDVLMIRLAPFFNKHIEDVLDRKLRPVASALQVRAQEEKEEQEYQEELRALAEKKRAIALEEMQLLKRRRVGQQKRPSRASYKQRGPREKSSAVGVIPV